jgi:protein SCO1
MKRFAICAMLSLPLVTSLSCSNSKKELLEIGEKNNSAKRYHLKGKVVSIDQKSKMANIDSEAIPDFMDAMTMPYQVKPETDLDKLKPGDAITADVVVQDEKAWLENIVVTGHAAAEKKKP